MDLSFFSVDVSSPGPSGAGTNVTVKQDLGPLGLRGHTLRSSAVKPVRAPGPKFPEGLDWVLERRARSGAQKGRAFGIWKGDQLVAACAWHLPPTGPLVIFDMACHADLGASEALRCAMAMILCLRTTAGHRNIRRGTDCVRWADLPFKHYPREDKARVRGEVRARAAALGFKKLRRPPKELRGKSPSELCF